MRLRSMPLVAVALLAAAAPATGQRPAPACEAEPATLSLPAGFCAILVADGLGAVRHIVVAPNGDIFANVQRGRQGGGGAIALRDTDGDGRADVRETLDLPGGNGIALRGSYLYVAPNDAVLRYRIEPGSLRPAARPDTLVMELPTGGHSNKSIAVSSDGSLFVNVGSRSNSCQLADRRNDSPGQDPCTELESRAGIWRFDADRLRQRLSDGQRWATGLRNTVAIALDGPGGPLYGVQHGRDQLFQNWGSLGYTAEDGAEKPSEILVEIRSGDDYGWPYCYHDRSLGQHVLAPEYGGDGRRAGRCAAVKEPLVAFPGHWAPNALAFYDGGQFPESYRGGAFIAFHGSWNRAPLPQQGFNVVFQPLSAGRPTGDWIPFAEGFQSLDPAARPTGLAVGPDGSLYVSDDAGGRIWRIVHR